MIKLYKLNFVFLFCVLLITSCSDDPNPGLGDLIIPPATPPSINSIEPQAGGLAGITVLTINGTNFSTTLINNSVYFNGVKGEILECTSTQLKVKPPIVVSDSVQVKVSVFRVEDFSNTLRYKLAPAAIELFPFDPNNNGTPYGITVDAQENVYASLGADKGIVKLNPQGVLTQWAPDGPESFFNSLTYGPSNTIYATRRVRGVIQVLENIPPATYVSYNAGIGGTAADTDFDQNLNMWVGANGTVIRITPAKVAKGFPFNGNVKAIRIFGNSIFAAATSNNEEVLWKIPIISADSLGTPENYFNFTLTVDSVIKMNDISISEDGDIYIGTDAVIDPIYIVHPDKSFEVLYPGVLSSSVNSLVWGNDNFLYMTRNAATGLTQTILKINMEKPGAIYFGR